MPEAAPVVQEAPPQNQLLAPLALAQTEKTRRTLTDKSKAEIHDIGVVIICAIAGLIIVAIAAMSNSTGLTFRSDLTSALPAVLSTLLIVSLFVERVIEVFVSVWSDREADEHEQNRDYWQSRQNQLKDDVANLLAERNATPAPSGERKAAIDALLKQKRDAIELANTNADTESKALVPFEARTRRISTWLGLALGMLVAGVGFRFLNQIVALNSIYDSGRPVTPQYGWFVVADVLLTGAVLAGGSKAIHQIFSVYDAFMKLTQDKLSNKTGTR